MSTTVDTSVLVYASNQSDRWHEGARRVIERPNVQVVGEADGFWTTFLSTAPPHSRGNDVPDAHLVALMRQNGVRRIYTRDQGFRRFAGIEILDLETSAR